MTWKAKKSKKNAQNPIQTREKYEFCFCKLIPIVIHCFGGICFVYESCRTTRQNKNISEAWGNACYFIYSMRLEYDWTDSLSGYKIHKKFAIHCFFFVLNAVRSWKSDDDDLLMININAKNETFSFIIINSKSGTDFRFQSSNWYVAHRWVDWNKIFIIEFHQLNLFQFQ